MTGLSPVRGPAGLLPNQLLGVEDTWSKIIVYRGGYRSGKTGFLVAKGIDLGRRNWPHPILAIEPSYTMIRSVFVECAQDMCSDWKMPCLYSVSRKVLTIGRRYPVRIWCRSADKPRSLEGLTVAALLGDEWELWPIESLKVGMARVSVGPCQQIVLGGTPEGFGPGYQLIEENPRPGTRVIVSRTQDNFFVLEQNPDYADDMRTRLSEGEAAEKLEGVRTAPEGRVFTRFDRAVHCAFAAADVLIGHVEVWAGFNEGKMVWAFVVVEERRSAFHVIGEVVCKHTDSQAQAEVALDWLIAWHQRIGRSITRADLRRRRVPALCDAEGQERGARAPRSHIANLQEAGFQPLFPKRNPAPDDRVASIQKVLTEKRLTFDEVAAPYFTRCVSQIRKANDGGPMRDGDLELGAHVLGNGIMWHSPAFRPSTAFAEKAAARRWQDQRKKGSPAGDPSKGSPIRLDLVRTLPGILLNRMAKAAPGGKHAGNAVRDLGCSIADFVRHIEAQFVDGMTWENHGKHGWHLDHKRPLASFNLENHEQFLVAAHFTNYQPLWASDNLKKGVKWDGGLAPDERRR